MELDRIALTPNFRKVAPPLPQLELCLETRSSEVSARLLGVSGVGGEMLGGGTALGRYPVAAAGRVILRRSSTRKLEWVDRALRRLWGRVRVGVGRRRLG